MGLVVSASSAQQRQRRGGGGGPAMYVAAKSVQEELKLSEDDAKKITDALRGISRDATPQDRAEQTKKILADNLKEDQIKRLNQIMWQRQGISQAISNPDVQTALKLDDQQKEKLKSIREEAAKKRQELGQPNADNRAKFTELRQKTNDDINALLTEDQKKAWKELQGPEFKGEIGRRRNNQ
jgi:hypothetical protein